jgi:hypothetical protein
MPAIQEYEFLHDGDAYSAVASVNSRSCTILVDQMPHLEFKVSLSDPDDIKLLLPTDKKGRRPSIACSTSEVPILEDAIIGAMKVVQAQVLGG